MPAEPQLPYSPAHAFQFLVRATQGQSNITFEIDSMSGFPIQFRTWHPTDFQDPNAKFPGLSFKYLNHTFCVYTGINSRSNHFCLCQRKSWGMYTYIRDFSLDTPVCLDIRDSVRALVNVFTGSVPKSTHTLREDFSAV